MSTTVSLPTLVELNQSNAGRNVFCLHTGGGGVDFYRDIASRLSEEARFFGLEEPSIYDDFEYSSLPELAEYHLDVIKEIQSDGPYTLFGYCSGGPVAYETACQLALEGDQVERLVLFGSQLDSVMMGLQPGEGNYLFLKHYLQSKYEVTLDEMDWQTLEQLSTDEMVQTVVSHLAKEPKFEQEIQQGWIDTAIKSLYLFHHAARRYSPSTTWLDIDLFDRYLDETQQQIARPWCDWNTLTSGNLNIIAAPALQGGHNDILRPPYVDNTANQLKTATFDY